MVRTLIYHVRYAICLWRNVPGMSLREAWRYPFNMPGPDSDPIEDALTEISYMGEG